MMIAAKLPPTQPGLLSKRKQVFEGVRKFSLNAFISRKRSDHFPSHHCFWCWIGALSLFFVFLTSGLEIGAATFGYMGAKQNDSSIFVCAGSKPAWLTSFNARNGWCECFSKPHASIQPPLPFGSSTGYNEGNNGTSGASA